MGATFSKKNSPKGNVFKIMIQFHQFKYPTNINRNNYINRSLKNEKYVLTKQDMTTKIVKKLL